MEVGLLLSHEAELSRGFCVQDGMMTRSCMVALMLFVFVIPDAAKGATAEEEAKFVETAKKAFDEKKPGELSKLTCWDGVSEEAKKKQEGVYKALVEEKDVSFSVKLVEPDIKSFQKGQKKERASLRQNLKIVKQLDLRLIDDRDRKTLGVIGFPVGEKDGKLLLTTETPAK